MPLSASFEPSFPVARPTAELPEQVQKLVQVAHEKMNEPNARATLKGFASAEEATKLLGQIKSYANGQGWGVSAPAKLAVVQDGDTWTMSFQITEKRTRAPRKPKVVPTAPEGQPTTAEVAAAIATPAAAPLVPAEGKAGSPLTAPTPPPAESPATPIGHDLFGPPADAQAARASIGEGLFGPATTPAPATAPAADPFAAFDTPPAPPTGIPGVTPNGETAQLPPEPQPPSDDLFAGGSDMFADLMSSIEVDS